MPSKLSYIIKLRPKAEEDLEAIWDYTAETWSLDQAETYLRALSEALDRLAENPLLYPERKELNPSVRIKPFKSHIILYRIDGETIDVIRVRHGREDWFSDA
ncbi:MAG: type II toxin-antitoxin system RelE/ParE family toxin [Pseudomonadota bacterium]